MRLVSVRLGCFRLVLCRVGDALRDMRHRSLQDEVRVNMELPAPVARERTDATFFEATGELRILMPLLSSPKGFGEGERSDV